MPIAALELFKKLAPVLVIILVISGTWFSGYNTGYNKCDKQFTEYRVTAETKAKQINDQLTQSAKIISETYEQNSKTNSDLTARNRQLLADRLQHPGPSNPNSTTPGTGDETASAYWVISEQTGRGFISEAARADEVVEIARACQEYVLSIQSAINEGD